MPDSEIREILLQLARQRGASKSFCPSEAARLFARKISQPGNWREWMDQVRADARQLEREGKLEFLQRGKRISSKPGQYRGPIRLRLLDGAVEEANHVEK
ncbi:DUF3253 domain-containing protein [bacterium]|nr:DUF3253 domain-containing protein [bacterium]